MADDNKLSELETEIARYTNDYINGGGLDFVAQLTEKDRDYFYSLDIQGRADYLDENGYKEAAEAFKKLSEKLGEKENLTKAAKDNEKQQDKVAEAPKVEKTKEEMKKDAEQKVEAKKIIREKKLSSRPRPIPQAVLEEAKKQGGHAIYLEDSKGNRVYMVRVGNEPKARTMSAMFEKKGQEVSPPLPARNPEMKKLINRARAGVSGKNSDISKAIDGMNVEKVKKEVKFVAPDLSDTLYKAAELSELTQQGPDMQKATLATKIAGDRSVYGDGYPPVADEVAPKANESESVKFVTPDLSDTLSKAAELSELTQQGPDMQKETAVKTEEKTPEVAKVNLQDALKDVKVTNEPKPLNPNEVVIKNAPKNEQIHAATAPAPQLLSTQGNDGNQTSGVIERTPDVNQPATNVQETTIDTLNPAKKEGKEETQQPAPKGKEVRIVKTGDRVQYSIGEGGKVMNQVGVPFHSSEYINHLMPAYKKDNKSEEVFIEPVMLKTGMGSYEAQKELAKKWQNDYKAYKDKDGLYHCGESTGKNAIEAVNAEKKALRSIVINNSIYNDLNRVKETRPLTDDEKKFMETHKLALEQRGLVRNEDGALERQGCPKDKQFHKMHELVKSIPALEKSGGAFKREEHIVSDSKPVAAKELYLGLTANSNTM